MPSAVIASPPALVSVAKAVRARNTWACNTAYACSDALLRSLILFHSEVRLATRSRCLPSRFMPPAPFSSWKTTCAHPSSHTLSANLPMRQASYNSLTRGISRLHLIKVLQRLHQSLAHPVVYQTCSRLLAAILKAPHNKQLGWAKRTYRDCQLSKRTAQQQLWRRANGIHGIQLIKQSFHRISSTWKQQSGQSVVNFFFAPSLSRCWDVALIWFLSNQFVATI